MIRRLLTLLHQDLTGSLRDNVLLYVIAAPLILAVLARVFLPSLERSVPACVVSRDVDPNLAGRLQAYLRVEPAADRRSLERRVLQPDDVAGVVQDKRGPVLILEGNEQPETRRLFTAALATVVDEQADLTFAARSLGGGRSYLREYVAIFLIMMATLLGGMVVGFNMVDDRHTRAFQALAVSPLPLPDYLASRSLFALLQGALVGLATTAIMLGPALPYGRLILAFAASAPLAATLGFLMAVTADNQISALGSTKLIMPAYLLVPVAALFLPERWQPVLYPFPNYWVFLTFKSLFVDGPQTPGFAMAGTPGFAMTALLAALSGLLLVLLLVLPLRRVFRFRQAAAGRRGGAAGVAGAHDR